MEDQKKQQELNKEARQNNPWAVTFNSTPGQLTVSAPKKNLTFINPPQRIVRSNPNSDNTAVYINGKLASWTEFDNLNQKSIASVNVFKSNGVNKVEVVTKYNYLTLYSRSAGFFNLNI